MNIVELENKISSIAFEMFLSWITTGDLAGTNFNALIGEVTSVCENLVESLILSSAIQAYAFFNIIMDTIVLYLKHSSLRFESTAIQYATMERNTIANIFAKEYIISKEQDTAAVKRLMMDDILACVDIKTFLNSISEQVSNHGLHLIKEILELSMNASREGCKVLPSWEHDPCRYHVHPGKPEGYSCTSPKFVILF